MRISWPAAIVTLIFTPLVSQTPAQAANTLPYSYGFVSIRECSALPCEDTTIQDRFAANYDYNADLSVIVANKGSARLKAEPGNGLVFELPILRAESVIDGAATSTAFVQAFQGYQNVSSQSLELGFSGQLDFQASGSGYGFVRPSLAILTSAVRDPTIGLQWLQATNDGAFLAGCQTPAAVSVVSGSRNVQSGTSSEAIDSSTGSCSGNPLFTVLPGESFYVLARLLTYQATPGYRDAFSTFRIELSPLVPDNTRDVLASALRPIALGAIPEPGSWALMLIGFALVGLTARRVNPAGDRRLPVP